MGNCKRYNNRFAFVVIYILITGSRLYTPFVRCCFGARARPLRFFLRFIVSTRFVMVVDLFIGLTLCVNESVLIYFVFLRLYMLQ